MINATWLRMVLSVIGALALTLVPLPDAVEPFQPDWVLLVLIFWAMREPERFSVGTAFVAGIFVDVAQGTMLGQHAFAMCFVIFLVVKLHLQLRVFPILQLTMTVAAVLAVYQFLLFWINGIAGVSAPSNVYWAPVISGTLLWPPLSMFMTGLKLRARG